MPKSKYETENPLGRKLLQVLAERGTPDDLPALAQAFAVSVPSTYDWIRHGRFAKERYPDLVRWSGRSLDWWFDCQPGETTAIATMSVNESTAPYGRPAWPFPNIPESRVCRLSLENRVKLQNVMLPVLDMLTDSELTP